MAMLNNDHKAELLPEIASVRVQADAFLVQHAKLLLTLESIAKRIIIKEKSCDTAKAAPEISKLYECVERLEYKIDIAEKSFHINQFDNIKEILDVSLKNAVND
jgi:hypothetical protein